MVLTEEKTIEESSLKTNKMEVMPIGRLIITMSLPMMISMLVQALYNIVDSLFVSRINDDAFNAVSLAFPFQNLMIAVAVGTGVGVNANVSKSLGEKNKNRADGFAKNGIMLAVLSGVVFMILTACITDIYITSQTDKTAVISYAKQYLYIIGFGCMGIFVQIMFERLLQSTGKTVLSMLAQGIGALVNIILDPCLIFGLGFFPKMGVRGAAAATVAGQLTGCALGLYLNAMHNREINISLKNFKPNGELIKRIYSIAVPGMIMTSVTSFMVYAFNLILATFDDIKKPLQSVLGAYVKLESMILMPIFGLNNGCVPIISYNYGAKNKSRVKSAIKHTCVYACAIVLVGTLIMQIFPAALLKIFKANEQMLSYGIPALRTISLSYLLAGISIVFCSAFQSLDHAVDSMIVSVARQAAVRLPAALALAKLGDPNLVWWSFPIGEAVAFILTVLFMFRVNKNVIRKIPDKA